MGFRSKSGRKQHFLLLPLNKALLPPSQNPISTSFVPGSGFSKAVPSSLLQSPGHCLPYASLVTQPGLLSVEVGEVPEFTSVSSLVTEFITTTITDGIVKFNDIIYQTVAHALASKVSV